MASQNGVIWGPDTLTPGLARFAVTMEIALQDIMEQVAEEVQQYAQTNAPWEDQTGEAREGLTAEFEQEGLDLTITLFHTAEYGIWLEIRNSGEYAIILPTIEQMGPVVMGAVATAFEIAS